MTGPSYLLEVNLADKMPKLKKAAATVNFP